MKSFSPAGMAVKAYYGLGARTFGNPDGATRGGGAYAAGGANPDGPDQGGGGGGGNQVVFQIEPTTNSSGPYDITTNTTLIDGITRTPIPSLTGVAPLGGLAPDPVLVNGLGLQVVGSVGVGPIWYYTVCLFGTVAQNFWTSMTFTTDRPAVVTLNSADADFNGLFVGAGFSIWAWEMPNTGEPPDFISSDTNITITWP